MAKTIADITRELRRNQTKAEKIVWQELKAYRLLGYKFRRQHPVIIFTYNNKHDYYVADFYCKELSLVIEIDGSIHDVEDIKEHDEGRQFVLESAGYTVLRFTNDEVFENIDNIVKSISEFINPLPESPSASREGL